jgi:Spy/CpxP family protein refolding chaperone
MKNTKILATIVIVLVAANCTLLVILWRQHFGGRPHDLPAPAYQFLVRELKLDQQQQVQYAALRRQHFEVTSLINDQNRILHDSLFRMVKDRDLNKNTVSVLQQKIAINQQRLDSATFYHFRQVRAILTAQQQLKFDEVLQDVLHIIGNPASLPGRPGLPPGGQGPPPGPAGQQGQPQWPPPGG